MAASGLPCGVRAGGRTARCRATGVRLLPTCNRKMKPPESGSASEQIDIRAFFFRVIEAFVSTAVQGRCPAH